MADFDEICRRVVGERPDSCPRVGRAQQNYEPDIRIERNYKEKDFRGGWVMRLAVTVIVVLLASALMSGCLHVSPLWPLKVDAESDGVRSS
jgi:hypothetical protein